MVYFGPENNNVFTRIYIKTKFSLKLLIYYHKNVIPIIFNNYSPKKRASFKEIWSFTRKNVWKTILKSMVSECTATYKVFQSSKQQKTTDADL